MHLLLDVLREGHEKLYARARREVASCAKKLGIAFVNVGEARRETLPESALADAQPFRPRGVRLFTRAFTARDILDPLLSFDLESLADPKKGCKPVYPAVFGIRRSGRIDGWATTEDLMAGGEFGLREFDVRQVVDLETPLSDVIDVLTHFSYCFFRLQDTVISFIVRHDIERPVVRMWLFGIIILTEMAIVEAIRRKWPGEA
jgi:hypothetical protein